jgi:hypothetical protein
MCSEDVCSLCSLRALNARNSKCTQFSNSKLTVLRATYVKELMNVTSSIDFHIQIEKLREISQEIECFIFVWEVRSSDSSASILTLFPNSQYL